MAGHSFTSAEFDGPGGVVRGPWWLWRHQWLRGHPLTLDSSDVMRCSCGRTARVTLPASSGQEAGE